MTLPLISLANLAEAAATQAHDAKVLAPFAASASAQHLKNFRTLHRQIGEMLAAADRDRRTAE